MPISEDFLRRISSCEYKESELKLEEAWIDGEEEMKEGCQDLFLTDEEGRGLVDALNRNPHITFLDSGGILISGSVIEFLLSTNKTLKSLSISTPGTDLINLQKSNLEEIYILGKASRRALKNMAKHAKLRVISLMQVGRGDLALEILSKSHFLEELSIVNSGVTDEGVRHLSKNLLALDLSYNRLTDVCVPYLLEFSRLKKLKITNNNLTATGIASLYRSGIDEIDVSFTFERNYLVFGFDSLHHRAIGYGFSERRWPITADQSADYMDCVKSKLGV